MQEKILMPNPDCILKLNQGDAPSGVKHLGFDF
jgi:hypothetical protein